MTTNLTAQVIEPVDYEKWDAFVEIADTGSIFATSKWIREFSLPYMIYGCYEDGHLVGGLPLPQRKYGWEIHGVSLPATPFIGFVLNFPKDIEDNNMKIESFNANVMNALADLVKPRYSRLTIPNHYKIVDLRPLQWSGFDTRLRYTYRTEAHSVPNDSPISILGARRRRAFRKAQKEGLTVEYGTIEDIDMFVDMHAATYERQNRDDPTSRQDITRVVKAGLIGKWGELLIARYPSRKSSSAIFQASDRRCSYYVWGASWPDHRNDGASTLLLATGMFRASKNNRAYDFAGANVQNISEFKSGFGAALTPFYIATTGENRIVHQIARFIKGKIL